MEHAHSSTHVKTPSKSISAQTAKHVGLFSAFNFGFLGVLTSVMLVYNHFA